jgi:uncharacterized coiled-coil protein SlyX
MNAQCQPELLRDRIRALRADIAAQKQRVERINAAITPRQHALNRLLFDLASREAAASRTRDEP